MIFYFILKQIPTCPVRDSIFFLINLPHTKKQVQYICYGYYSYIISFYFLWNLILTNEIILMYSRYVPTRTKTHLFPLNLVIILWSKKLEILDNINKEDFEETF